jgi:AAA+ ATPase superfamily predicted ATPase
MLFDLNPKERMEDIYDRREEHRLLSNSLAHKERLVVIYGIRRVGKTSLIRATLNEKNFAYASIDLKQLYFRYGSVPSTAFSELIASEFVRYTERLELDGGTLDRSADGNRNLTELLKDIDRWCAAQKMFFVIAFDEAQYLRYGGKVRYDGIIAWCIDNLANIGFVLTGSEVGVLKDFLRYDDIDAPLYGRFRGEIYLDKFSKEKSRDFLKKGFLEYDKKTEDSELDEAAEEIGGIAGWLTYYGYYRSVNNLSHKDAIDKVFDEGSKITVKEIEALISHSRKRYIYILKAITNKINTWTEIKDYVTAKSGGISDTVLNGLLQNLLKFGLIDRGAKEEYELIDPIIKHAVSKLKP